MGQYLCNNFFLILYANQMNLQYNEHDTQEIELI